MPRGDASRTVAEGSRSPELDTSARDARFVVADEDAALDFLNDALATSTASVREDFWKEAREAGYADAWKVYWDAVAEGPREPRQGHAVFRELSELARHLLAAIHGYTRQTPNVCRGFNEACRRAASADDERRGWEGFRYKSFWWLLLEGILTLDRDPEGRIWRATKGERLLLRGLKNVAVPYEEGDTVIFGQFLSTSQTALVPEKFTDEDSPLFLGLRGVPRRLYREVTGIGFYKHFEVLVAPFCVFRYSEKRVRDLGHLVVLDFVESLLDRKDVRRRIRERFTNGDDGAADYFEPTEAPDDTEDRGRGQPAAQIDAKTKPGKCSRKVGTRART